MSALRAVVPYHPPRCFCELAQRTDARICREGISTALPKPAPIGVSSSALGSCTVTVVRWRGSHDAGSDFLLSDCAAVPLRLHRDDCPASFAAGASPQLRFDHQTLSDSKATNWTHARRLPGFALDRILFVARWIAGFCATTRHSSRERPAGRSQCIVRRGILSLKRFRSLYRNGQWAGRPPLRAVNPNFSMIYRMAEGFDL